MRHSDWGSYVCSSGLLLGTADGPATGPEADETRAVAGWVLDQILVLLHPFMPFITEELWHAGGARDHELIVAHWPSADAQSLDAEAVKEIDWLIRLVSDLRTARTERSEERRAGQEWVMTCRSRWTPYHKKKK